MTIAIVIVNYQGAQMVLDHLERVRNEARSFPGSHIYIVDNASPGGDAGTLTSATDAFTDVTVVAAERNGGFSYGNNRGFERAIADGGYSHYFMLNPDAYPKPGALQTLLDFLEARPEAGVVGPRLVGEDGIVQRSAFNDPTPARELLGSLAIGGLYKLFGMAPVARPAADDPHETDWVSGAAVMLTADALAKAGMMDEDYFLYFEELDHHRAVRDAGLQVWHCPQAEAVHLVGQTTGITDGKSAGRSNPPPFWYESRHRYFSKHFGPRGARLADLARGIGRRVWAIRFRLSGRPANTMIEDIERMTAARAAANVTVAERT